MAVSEPEASSPSVGEIHQEFAGWLTGYARMLDARYADDAVQDAFAAHAQRSERPPPVRNPQGYLVSCVKNSVAKANRFPRRLLGRPEVHLDAYRDPDLVRALRGLSPAQREVLVLRFGDDRTIAQIAQLLEVSESTVRTHLERGLSKLRERLGTQS